MARRDQEIKPHPTLTKRQAEIRRIATELFAKQGYRAVGMRAIADAVGIRTSSLYYHFESKEEILYSIGLDITRDFVEAHLPILDGPEPAAERLAALVRAHVTFFVRHRLDEMVGKSELRELSPEHFEAVTSTSASTRSASNCSSPTPRRPASSRSPIRRSPRSRCSTC